MSADDEYAALLRQIRHLARALDLQSRRIDREMGLTLPQLLVLTMVGRMGAQVTGRAISAAADLSPPTVVGIFDKLEAKGLIARYRSDRDRRIVHAALTDRGRDVLAQAPDPLGARLRAAFTAMPGLERAQLLASLARLGALADAPADDTA